MSPWQGEQNSSHDSDLVGYIKSILVLRESNVGLLLTLWSNQSVNFLDLNLIKFSTSFLDHFLIGFLVNDENKSVAVFDGLDGGLTRQWVLDNSILIESNDWLNSFQDVLW